MYDVALLSLLSISCLESETLSMFVPLGKTVHTPWQRVSLLTDSAKGIRIDYMLVMHIGKRWRSPFSRVL